MNNQSAPNTLLLRSMHSVIPGNADRLFVQAAISPFELSDRGNPMAVLAKSTVSYQGIFDTGASRSCVSESLAAALNLPSVGKQTVHTANGAARQNRHVVNITLPNQIVFPRRTVTAAKLHGIDFLLGMDVIGAGDFSVTNHHGFKMVRFDVFLPIVQPPPTSAELGARV